MCVCPFNVLITGVCLPYQYDSNDCISILVLAFCHVRRTEAVADRPAVLDSLSCALLIAICVVNTCIKHLTMKPVGYCYIVSSEDLL